MISARKMERIATLIVQVAFGGFVAGFTFGLGAAIGIRVVWPDVFTF